MAVKQGGVREREREYVKRGGAVVARQAHNLQVGWSKLPSAAFLKGYGVKDKYDKKEWVSQKEHKNGSTRVRTGDPHYVKVMW